MLNQKLLAVFHLALSRTVSLSFSLSLALFRSLSPSRPLSLSLFPSFHLALSTRIPLAVVEGPEVLLETSDQIQFLGYYLFTQRFV